MRKGKHFGRSAALMLTTVFGACAVLSTGRPAQPGRVIQTVGGTPEDAYLASNKPVDFAWKLFFAINNQALLGEAGVPDASRPFPKSDPDHATVWETWALSSGGRDGGAIQDVPGNHSEVFKNGGVDPGAWADLPRGNQATKRFFEHALGQQLDVEAEAGKSSPSEVAQGFHFSPLIDNHASGKLLEGDEVRMNQATYEFVRQNNLYNVEGLEAQFKNETQQNAPPISFPQGSQEIKAQWRPIAEGDKPRFHWRNVTVTDSAGKTSVVAYGLVGLHIITKDLPNWFWCDFEQEDYANGAETAGLTTPPHIADKLGTTEWSHYVLRGTQTDFTDSLGRNTILANTVIEHGFQQTSSCITCHSRATVGLRDPKTPNQFVRLATFLRLDQNSGGGAIPVGSIGPVKPDWFFDSNGNQRYIQTDFVWSLPFRVLSKKH